MLAVRLGKGEETLRKEIAGDSKFKLGMRDALAISEMCIEAQSEGCYSFVNAIAGKAGHMVALPVRDMAPAQNMRADMAGMLKECSDAFGVITEALADERISDNEMRQISREMGELFGKAQEVLQQARARNEASKPASLRRAA